MFSKPFKPLTIRKPAIHDGRDDFPGPAPKRQKLSSSGSNAPILARELSSSKTRHEEEQEQEQGGDREALKAIRNPPTPAATSVQDSDTPVSYYSVLWFGKPTFISVAAG